MKPETNTIWDLQRFGIAPKKLGIINVFWNTICKAILNFRSLMQGQINQKLA